MTIDDTFRTTLAPFARDAAADLDAQAAAVRPDLAAMLARARVREADARAGDRGYFKRRMSPRTR